MLHLAICTTSMVGICRASQHKPNNASTLSSAASRYACKIFTSFHLVPVSANCAEVCLLDHYVDAFYFSTLDHICLFRLVVGRMGSSCW